MTNFPSEWRIVSVGDVVSGLKSGLSRKLSPSDIGLPVLRSNNLMNGGGVDYTDIKYWYVDDPQGAKTENYVLRDDDLLINFINSISAIGKASIYSNLLGRDVIYTTNIMCLRVKRKSIIPQYFLYLTQTQEYDKYIQAITKPAVNQASFTTVDFKHWEFPLPPLPEQRKIAQILGTWDEAIATTEKLIAALERRKQGLMQRLLIVPQHKTTPINRLPGFQEKWVRKPLGEVFQRVTRKNGIGNQNVLTASAQHGLVSQTDYFNRKVASDNLDNYYLLMKSEFAYNKSSSDGYPFGAIKQLEGYEAGVLSTLYICFQLADESCDGTFYKHFFEAGGMNRGIYSIAQEGARNHGLLNIGLSDFFGLEVPVPSWAEQIKLAEFFELQNKQIEVAKRQLRQVQEQKKGLMQRLLTGQVRVGA